MLSATISTFAVPDSDVARIADIKAYADQENLHEANREDDYDPDLPLSGGLEIPDRMYWHEKNDQVSQRVADATRIEQRRHVDACPWYGLIPDALSRRTFPYLYDSSGNVEKT